MDTETKREPDVEIFGHDTDKRVWHHQHHGSTAGVLFIFLGIILLLNTLQVLPWTVWQSVIRFWPVLLVLAGLKIILGRSLAAHLVVSLASVIILGTVLLLILQKENYLLVADLPPVLMKYLDSVRNYFPQL